MKLKKLLTKSLLATAALCFGANGAWAAVGDVTTNANIDFSNAISDNAVAGSVNSMALPGTNFELGYTSGDPATTTLGDVLRVGNGEGTVTIADEDLAGARDEVVITFDMYFGNLNGKSAGFYLYDNAETPEVIGGLYISKYSGTEVINSFGVDKSEITSLGSSSVANNKICVAANKTTFEVHLNYASGTMYLKQYTNETLKQTTSTVAMGSTKPLKKFVVKSNYNNADRRCWFDNLLIQTTEGDYTVSSAKYTINWVCGGTTVKTEERTGDVGSTITLYNTDDDSFVVSDTRYMYVSNDAEGKTVAEDGSTVITITVKEPSVFNYSVKAVDAEDNVLSTIASGSVTEDNNSVTTNIPWYVLKDGTIYYQSVTNQNKTDVTSDGQEIKITYAENASNIVYYAEGENITGGTGITLTNGSNYGGARALSNVKFTTIGAGKYKIYSRFNVGNGSEGATYATNPFIVGKTALEYNVPAKSVTSYTSEEFSVTGSTDLYVNFSGSSISGVDYIYVQKTGDVELPASVAATLGKNGYATFASIYDLDLSNLSGVKAYTATLEGKVLSFVENTGKVAAGTGLLLIGESDAAVTIPVAAAGAAAVEGNALTGVTAATDLQSNAEGNYIFVLKKAAAAADALTFLPLSTEAAVTVPAGKAYVSVPASAFAADARTLTVSFGDATGIAAVENAKVAEGIYNLNGQRVAQPAKGLYIVNGKKVIVNK